MSQERLACSYVPELDMVMKDQLANYILSGDDNAKVMSQLSSNFLQAVK